MRIPQPGDLRDLPVHEKPEWRGVVANIVGAFLWLGRKLGSTWARTVFGEFFQVIDGRIYAPPGKKPSVSLQGHEAVHDWQARTVGGIRYTLGYFFSKRKRQHYEAMAYGYEVAIHGRNLEERARTAAHPVYRMGWSAREARELIGIYAAAFRMDWQ